MSKYITTYVLGAGFSRAAHDALPLSADFFSRVREKRDGETPYLQMNPSLQALDDFVSEYFPVSPDLEAVMSFLSQTYFPPGFRQHWQHRRDLYIELLSLIAQVYGSPMVIDDHKKSVLHAFARKVTNDNSNILTFNYDCILDTFLRKTKQWNPFSGYGTMFRHISDCFHNTHLPEVDSSAISLLKLHGSVNWGTPYINSHEQSLSEVFFVEPDLAGVGSNIAVCGVNLPVSTGLYHGVGFQLFIVPPVSDKASMYQNGLLRRLWYFAREILVASDRVVFVGYSFPPTDYLASFLIREAFGSHLAKHTSREVIFVNKKCDQNYKKRVRGILINSEVTFVEEDALSFIDRFVTEKHRRSERGNISLYPKMHSPRMPFVDNVDSNIKTSERHEWRLATRIRFRKRRPKLKTNKSRRTK